MKLLSLLLAAALGEPAPRGSGGRWNRPSAPLGGGRRSGRLTSEPPLRSHPGSVTVVSAGPAVMECWLVEDGEGGRLTKRPAALLLRQGPGEPPLRPDLDPELYLKVHGESSRARPRPSASAKPLPRQLAQ